MKLRSYRWYRHAVCLAVSAIALGCGVKTPPQPPCPAGAHEVQHGCDGTVAQWTPGPSLRTARDHHVTFVAESPAGVFLYALAGTNPEGGAAATVERAPIRPDGSLAPFEALADLPTALIGPGFAEVEPGLVLAGGLGVNGDSVTDTFVGGVLDDGRLELRSGPPLAHSRYHTAVVAVKGFVFALGGLQQSVSTGAPTQAVLDSVERAPFDGTTLGPWTEAARLPTPLTHHAALAHGDAIYVIGGGSSAAARTEILRAEVSDGGELGAFRVVGNLPAARATSSAFVFLDHLYVLAGAASLTSGEVATVLRAPIAADGSVGAFEELAALPMARAHSHQSPFHDGVAYSVGGSIHHVPQNEVFIARFQ